ncbi:MAG TPA: hypothetical protein VHS80_00910, partial [Chthoniobacterales bacterium]|nr:hypothetical protein [Chthoniobacterales bacterium]
QEPNSLAGWEITSSLSEARVSLVAFNGIPSGAFAQHGGEGGILTPPIGASHDVFSDIHESRINIGDSPIPSISIASILSCI